MAIYGTMYAGAAILLLMAVAVVVVLYPYTIVEGIKSDTKEDMSFIISVSDREYLADLYKRTKDIYYSLPGELTADPFTDEYKEKFIQLTEEEGYRSLRTFLDKCREEHGLSTIAFVFYDTENKRVVFVADGDRREYMYIPGQWISNENGSIDSIRSIRLIERSNWIMSLNHGELSGWTMTNYASVMNDGGEEIGLMYVDVDVSRFVKKIHLFTFVAYLVMMFVVIILMMNRISEFLRSRVIQPITALSKTALQYTARDKTLAVNTEGVFKKLNIHTRDEIEDLWRSLTDMESDIDDTMMRIRKMTSRQERLDTELSIANQIQSGILPGKFPAFPDRDEFSIYAYMQPARNVAGDFYDFFLTDDDHIALVIADVSDKGIPAALFMMTARTLVRDQAMMYSRPSEILSRVNERLCEGNEAAIFVTIWLAIIDLNTGKGIVSNAGHMHPAFCARGDEYRLVFYEHSLPVGIVEDADFEEHGFSLDPGDQLFVYTDGVNEAINASGEQFGLERLLQALNSGQNGSPERVIGSVMDAIKGFTVGGDQADDITMLSFCYSPKDGLTTGT